MTHQLALFDPAAYDWTIAGQPLGVRIARQLQLATLAWLVLTPRSASVRAMHAKVRDLEYDQALQSGVWRLEYAYSRPPRYRLRHHRRLIGVARAVPTDLRALQRQLATLLMGLGRSMGEWEYVTAHPPLEQDGEERVLQIGALLNGRSGGWKL